MAGPESGETPALQTLRSNLLRVRETVAAACQRAGRDPHSVCLVAVTKSVDLPVIRALLSLGVTELGENRVQQLVARAEQLGSRLDEWRDPPELPRERSETGPTTPRWHLVGHLQRNKVKAVLRHAHIIHSLDSVRLADEIGTVAERLDVYVDAFLEVNVSGEAGKGGVFPAELERMAAAVQAHPRLRLRGLMTMTPFDPDPEHARPHFVRLRELLRQLQETGAVRPECVHLSMGMSQDYAVAIEEGATFVRVGTALFENLPPPGVAPGY